MFTMPWWRSLGLGLAHDDDESTGEDVRKRRTKEELLTEFIPTSFEGNGRTVSLVDATARTARAVELRAVGAPIWEACRGRSCRCGLFRPGRADTPGGLAC